jgi:hypothetical protein
MGTKKMKKKSIKTKQKKFFNTPIDIGLRVLFLLQDAKKLYDLQSLVYLDYFLVHSGDVPGGPESLHPNSPHHAIEILVKRKLMQDGLRAIHKKQLIDISLENKGVYYAKNKLTGEFLKHYSNSLYAEELRVRSKWVFRKFGKYDEEKLKKYVDANIKKWGTEFLDSTTK